MAPTPVPGAPLVVAVEMGYGHLRAAQPIAEALGVPMLSADREPLVDAAERRLWDRVRAAYELTSRASQIPIVGRPLRFLLERVTNIPGLDGAADLSAPTAGVRFLEALARRGLGRGLLAALADGRPLVTTFFVPALVADRASVPGEVFCVATDSDLSRSWAPPRPGGTRIRYLAPTSGAAKRLRQYGVPADRVAVTGFPLPHGLVGGRDYPALKRNLASRLVRLDPRRSFRSGVGGDVAQFLGPLPAEMEGQPPVLTFAVGGAGAQVGLAARFLPSLRAPILDGRLRLALVAGTREAARDRLEEAVADARLEPALGQGLELLHEADLVRYFGRFNDLLARTDMLWTKPSELTFYAALGLPILCASPVGVHERRNRRWVREAGAGIKQRDPRFAASWIADMLDDGQLAAAAWAGYVRLPKDGLYRIVDAVEAARAGARPASGESGGRSAART